MATDFGPGVSRTLNPVWRQFSAVVWQQDAPPLDSEFNLMSQMDWERLRQAVKAAMPSGFIMDPTRALNEYQFNSQWVNQFSLGRPKTGEENPVIWANVNGWILPVAGTDTVEGDLQNIIRLYPPPGTDGRVDLVFLEAWQVRIDPNPSTASKPTASTLYKYGNTKYGGVNLPDDLEDPAIGYETTGRIQVQYRLRVFGSGGGLGAGVAIANHPDGLDDPNILGQGASASPIGGFTWVNMREALGDPSLWRAGDGDPNNALGTVDGYTYAIPVCAVFRRNSNPYVAVTDAGNPNQNGAFLRTPNNAFLPDPLAGCRLLTTATLTSNLSPTATGTVNITGLNGSGLEDPQLVLSSTFLVIDDEIVGVSAVNLIGSTITIPVGGRGRYGTAGVGHPAGTVVRFYNTRPDGLYADQVAMTDILDLRRAVNPGDWDFQRLLQHNVASLAKNQLRSTWKVSGAGDTEGVTVHEVDDLYAGGTTHPNHTDPVDGTDGIRTVFSDAAAIQPEVNLLLDNEATLDATNFTADQFDTTVAWDTGPDFHPIGFMNNGNGTSLAITDSGFSNGSTVLMFIGGANGSEGARGTFRDGSDRAVRFVMPKEYWRANFPEADVNQGNQYPIQLRFIDQRAFEPAPAPMPATEAARHVGPMYPWRDQNFERPFIALGGILNSSLRLSRAVTNLTETGGVFEIDLGINFETAGLTFSKDAEGNFENNPALVSLPLLRAQRTLYGMMTDNGRDQTGASSEVYLVVYGDPDSYQNNGAFKVIGAGRNPSAGGAGFTSNFASNATSVVVQPLSVDCTTFDSATGNSVVIEFRSPYHNAEDTSDFATRVADLAVVLTDIGGLSNTPWARTALGYGETYDLSMPEVTSGPLSRADVPSKLLIDLTLMYHPGRGATARVPDEVVRFSMRGGVTNTIGAYLRQSPAVRDTTFPAASGAPDNEAFWDFAHVSTWNRLPALGWNAPLAPNYGGNVVGFTEMDREHELFLDRGSKTVIFRPFRDRGMTLHSLSFTGGELGSDCLLGPYSYPEVPPVPKDSMVLFTGTSTSGKQMGFAVPREYMPRFGRQDIPYWVDTTNGAGPFLPGINHLFRDSSTLNEPVFNVIGGESNISGGTQVLPLFLATGQPNLYGHSGTIIDPLNNRPFYAARKTTDINPSALYAQGIIDRLNEVQSSDLGHGLQGIQLPPYLGIARLYGVYEASDYVARGGQTFQVNRYTPAANPARNLIREDADQQTLFILQNGAQDLTQAEGDHTYIIPSNVLDLTRIPGYVAGQGFGDFDYVIEATVFGFSRGFIDENNYVLVRRYNGEGRGALGGLENTDGDVIELEDVHMVIPCPAASNDHFYAAYNRTVYQGDPFMTRAGNTLTTSDYEARYGQIPVNAQYALRTPIQQFDANGNFLIQTPNARAFEVLASMDFYTTLGTGKVGGAMFPGTPLDVGFTTPEGASRMPNSATTPPWRVLTRAYTEGQKNNENRARLDLQLLNNGVSLPALNPSLGSSAVVRVTRLDGEAIDLYATTQANYAAYQAAPYNLPASDLFLVDTTSQTATYSATATAPFATVAPGAMATASVTVTGAQVGDVVTVNPSVHTNGVLYQGRVSAANTVQLAAHYTQPDVPFEVLAAGNEVRPMTVNLLGPVAPGATGTGTLTGGDATGVAIGDALVVNVPSTGGWIYPTWAYVDGANNIQFQWHNTTGVPLTPGPTTFNVAIIRESTLAPVNIAGVNFAVQVTRLAGSLNLTAQNLAATINAHPDLTGTITALASDDTRVTIEAVPVGEQGNGIRVSVRHTGAPTTLIQNAIRVLVPYNNARPVGAVVTASYLMGGRDEAVNAGNGTTPLALVGMTERLPLGILLQDSDFLCENPLNDEASAMNSRMSGPRPVQTILPLTTGGEEFDRFLGEPGELVAMADGAILQYVGYTTATPTGTRRFRLYRGGGSAFVLSGTNPGGPVDWVSESFEADLRPVLKGGALVCRAMLVRDFFEEAFPTDVVRSEGDEIQMVIVTYGILGTPETTREGVTLKGVISPTGYGEGYAAADRYRLNGKPMFLGQSREVRDPANVTLAVYPTRRR
jgi:hypothetical protein